MAEAGSKGSPVMPALTYEVGSQGGVPLKTSTPAPVKKDVKTEVLLQSIGAEIVQLRSLDDELTRFEPEYALHKGSTENSYLIQADKTALMDVPEGAWAEAFAAELKSNLKGRPLDYIMLGHFNPRIAKTLAAVLNAQPKGAPPVEIWCSNVSVKAISSLLKMGSPAFNRQLYQAWKRGGMRARLVRVTTGDTLDLGQGHQMSFFLSGTPRWPESMFAYDSKSQKFFSSKFFGAHINAAAAMDEGGMGAYGEDWAFYLENLLGPVAAPAKRLLDRIGITVVEENKVPEGVTTAFEKEVVGLTGLETGWLVNLFRSTSKAAPRARGSQAAAAAEAAAAAAAEAPAAETAAKIMAGKLAVATICPRHGPVVVNSITELVDSYQKVLTKRLEQKEDVTVGVIFASAYGNTGRMADGICAGLTKAGVNVKLMDCEFATAAEVAGFLQGCAGFAVGSPTLGGHVPTPVSEAIGAILKTDARDLPYGVFGSYGWSGEAVPAMQNALRDGGFLNAAFDPVSLKFTPTDEMMELLEADGELLALEVKRTLASKKSTQAKTMAKKVASLELDERVRAIGHITTSLSVITANINGEDSMVPVTWVSQASFNPPGITVSVPKEGSPDGLTLLNAKFSINIMGAGKQGPTLKLLNSGTRVGATAFDGFSIEREEVTGCAYLTDAASVMQCTVTNRMDTGDHWLLLSTIEEGKVLDANAVTYFHHREDGSVY